MTTNCPWCGKPEATTSINASLAEGDSRDQWCWGPWQAKGCDSANYKAQRERAQTAECRVAELESERLVLWFFLTDNPDQPMPPGANPCKQAIEVIQALRAEVTRLKDERDEALGLANSDSARLLLGMIRDQLCPKPDDDLVKRVVYLRSIEAERDRLAERLPVTADGVRVIQGDTVYDINGNECEYLEHCRGCECDRGVTSLSFDEIASHYSTRAAAEAARAKGGA